MINIENNLVRLDVNTNKLYPFRNATAYLADGYERTISYQQGKWDGYNYIIDHEGKCLGGHLHKIISYFPDEPYTDFRNIPEEINIWNDLVPAQIGKYILTNFQKQAYLSMCPNLNGILFPRGIIGVAPNGGKSLIMGTAVKSLLKIKPNIKILFLFLQVELLDQMSVLFNEIDIEHDILLSKSDMAKRKLSIDIKDSKILLTMAKTVYGQLDEFGTYIENFDCVFIDECHLATAAQINEILTKCKAWGRWGFSGTAFDGKTEEQINVLLGQFGPMLYKVTNKELIDSGISAEPTIYSVQYDFLGRFITYQDGLNILINSLERNNIAFRWIKKNPHKRYLVVVELLDHIDILLTVLKEFNPLPLHGQLGTKKRKNNLDSFKNKECNCLVTNGVAKHGLNVQDINCIIYLRAGKSPVWLNQIIGRGLRLKSIGEQEFDVVDVYDNIHIFRPQSDQRLDLYKAEGYTVKQINVSSI